MCIHRASVPESVHQQPDAAVCRREALISAGLNAALSAGMFQLVFGGSHKVSLDALGPDFLLQSFMISLMGSIVPGFMTLRALGARHARAYRAVATRGLAVALTMALVLGGPAWIACAALPIETIAATTALWVKTIFGAVLGLCVTLLAVRHAYRQHA